jgi:hypothetical protein
LSQPGEFNVPVFLDAIKATTQVAHGLSAGLT